MTLEQVYTLQDVFEEALRATGNGSNRDAIRWMQMHRRTVLDNNSMTIEAQGLNNMLRAFRKKRPDLDAPARIHNLCLDFGIEDLDLDEEISVPTDMDNLLSCACDWPDIDDTTVADLDKHIELLKAQSDATLARAGSVRILRQAAARIVPDRTDIPLRKLREIARSQKAQ